MEAPSPVAFSLTGLTNPPSTARKNFAVTTYNQDGLLYVIDYSDLFFYIDYTPGSLTVTDMSFVDTEINSKTGELVVQFFAAHQISTSYRAVIQLPSEITVQQLSGCNIIPQFLNFTLDNSYGCNADGNSNQIVLSNWLQNEVD